jgi:hypothetical protein
MNIIYKGVDAASLHKRIVARAENRLPQSHGMVVRKDKCFICGTRKEVENGICEKCRRDFPTK